MQKRPKINVYEIVIHVISWSILFMFPLVLANNEHTPPPPALPYNIALYALFLFLFYINYCCLVERLLQRRKTLAFVAINVVLIVISCVILHSIHEAFHPEDIKILKSLGGKGPSLNNPPVFGKSMNDLLSLILCVGLSTVLRMVLQSRRLEKRNLELEQERSEAELKNLKQQLNPHFIFNTLNNIYALVAIDSEKARQAILELSNLLRYILYENKERYVPVEQEVTFISDYIELMRLRYTQRASIRVSIDVNECKDDVIAPLLFIPIIENAFKHSTDVDGSSFINIDLSISAPHTICCKVENSNHPKNDSDRSGSGVGLENLSRQLQLLYPERYTLDFEVTEKIYTAILIINLQKTIAQ